MLTAILPVLERSVCVLRLRVTCLPGELGVPAAAPRINATFRTWPPRRPADTGLVLLRSVLDRTKTLLMQVDSETPGPMVRLSRVTLNVVGRRRSLTCNTIFTIPSAVLNEGLTNELAGDIELIFGAAPEVTKKPAGKESVTVF